MKKTIITSMKRIASLVLVMALMFTMGMTAMATEGGVTADTYTITINNSNPNHTYGAYQVFTGDLANGVLSNIEWGASVGDDSTAFLTALKGDATIGSQFTECTTAQDVADVIGADDYDSAIEFATVVGKYFEDKTAYANSIYNTANYTITAPAGYYLIKDDKSTIVTDADTEYILQVVEDTGVTPKSGVPTVEKKVLEDRDDIGSDNYTLEDLEKAYNDVADWDINQTKSFIISANLPEKMWTYEDGYYINFNDSFDKGITVTDAQGNALTNESFSTGHYNVYYYIAGAGAKKTLPSNTFIGTLTQSVGETGGILTFSCADIKAALASDTSAVGEDIKVVIEYNAELNINAVVGLTGNFNKVDLDYSDNPYDVDMHGKTQPDEVVVFTFQIEGTKLDGSDKATELKDAEFKLGNNAGSWAKIDKDTGKFIGWTTLDDATPIISGTDGKFNVIGLDSGTYLLRETKAPAGYNILDGDITIEVTSTVSVENSDSYEDIYTQEKSQTPIKGLYVEITEGTETTKSYYDNATPTVLLKVYNQQGSTLPETGDTGRAIFYALGAMGISITGIILITRKRMSQYSKSAKR